MPLIEPNFDEELIQPERPKANPSENERRCKYVNEYLDVPHWRCPSCGLTNFGRNKKCADFKCRLERPWNYVEPPLPEFWK